VQVIPKPLAISYTTLATKVDPLTNRRDTRIPNHRMISFSRYLATSWASSVILGKAYTHPEKLQTNTNRYFHPRAHGISVKPTNKFSRGVPPMLSTWGGNLGHCQGWFWHIGYIFHILPYLCWRVWGYKSAGLGWSQGLFALNEFLPGTS
jgi:hypothetical protein